MDPMQYSYPYMQTQQQSPWSWASQGRQANGSFNPSAMTSWGGGGYDPGQAQYPGGGGFMPNWGSGGGQSYTGGYAPPSYGGMYGAYPYDPYSGYGSPTGGGYPYGGFGLGGLGGSFGPYPDPNQNPLQRGSITGTTPTTPTGTGSTQIAGQTPVSAGYTPTTPTYTANPVTDPSLAAYQSWGQSTAPTLIPTVTASMLGYGTAPPGSKGYNPNTGQWE